MLDFTVSVNSEKIHPRDQRLIKKEYMNYENQNNLVWLKYWWKGHYGVPFYDIKSRLTW